MPPFQPGEEVFKTGCLFYLAYECTASYSRLPASTVNTNYQFRCQAYFLFVNASH